MCMNGVVCLGWRKTCSFLSDCILNAMAGFEPRDNHSEFALLTLPSGGQGSLAGTIPGSVTSLSLASGTTISCPRSYLLFSAHSPSFYHKKDIVDGTL